MRRFDLDFQRRPRPSAWGWLLLAAGTIALAGLLQVQWQQSQQRQDQGHRLARLRAAGLPAAAPAAEEARDDPALAAARLELERSLHSWDKLFSALEAADQGDVALLAVIPDTQRRQVKIHAEARDLNAMLGFQLQLQQQPALAQVVLLDHMMVAEAPQAPVRFHLLALWGGAHGVR